MESAGDTGKMSRARFCFTELTSICMSRPWEECGVSRGMRVSVSMSSSSPQDPSLRSDSLGLFLLSVKAIFWGRKKRRNQHFLGGALWLSKAR